MPGYCDDGHLRVIEVWIVPAKRLRITHCSKKVGVLIVRDLVRGKFEGIHPDAMPRLFIIASDFAAHPEPTRWDAHHHRFAGFDPGCSRGCHAWPSNPNFHLQLGEDALRRHDTLQVMPRAKITDLLC
jgi:hypothetical protein